MSENLGILFDCMCWALVAVFNNLSIVVDLLVRIGEIRPTWDGWAWPSYCFMVFRFV